MLFEGADLGVTTMQNPRRIGAKIVATLSKKFAFAVYKAPSLSGGT